MNESHWDIIWSSFRRLPGSTLATAASIPLAVVLWLFVPSQLVPMSLVLALAMPILLMGAIIVMTLLDATNELFKINTRETNKIKLPNVLTSIKEKNNNYIKCLLEPSELFSEDIAVSFYYAPPDSFEVHIGIGHVELIRMQDRKIQVLLVQSVEGYDAVIEGLANNNETIRKNVYIKPNVPRSYISR